MANRARIARGGQTTPTVESESAKLTRSVRTALTLHSGGGDYANQSLRVVAHRTSESLRLAFDGALLGIMTDRITQRLSRETRRNDGRLTLDVSGLRRIDSVRNRMLGKARQRCHGRTRERRGDRC